MLLCWCMWMSAGVVKAIEGSWRGEGIGEYPPTIAPFQFHVNLAVKVVGPLIWEVRIETKHFDTAELLSIEMGSIKCKPCDNATGKIEASLVHVITGMTEVACGNYCEDAIELTCRNEGLCQSSFETHPFIMETRRVLQLKRNSDGKAYLEMLVEKATTENSMQSFLVARLFQIR